jgi:hypothetical protein
MKIIAEDGTDIQCIQEPYTIQNKIVGMPKKYKIFASGEGRNRAAIVVTNNQVDILLIKQLSDVDTVVLEVIIENAKIILASIYLDIRQQIDIDLTKMEAIIQHAKGAGVLIAMDSNSRSTSWYDTLTNTRGRILEEFLMSKQLHIMNEESDYTIFRSCRGTSNIDLTVISNQLLRTVVEWEISGQESCSDHSIIRYAIALGKNNRTGINFQDARYTGKTDENWKEFDKNLSRFVAMKFRMGQGNLMTLDRDVALQVEELNDIESAVDLFQEALISSCNKSFKIRRASTKMTTHKSVPWWTVELTIMRKRTNALRRRYQRTTNNNELRESRKNQYQEEKTKYQAAI